MLGLAQSTVALFHTHHLLAISQQVEHTMSFTHQLLATLIKHLVDSNRRRCIDRFGWIGSADDSTKIVYSLSIVVAACCCQLGCSLSSIEIGF